MENQTVTDKDEKKDEKDFEREKNGLIRDLSEQRKKNRALEERIALIESSLFAQDETPPQPADVKVQKFSQDPDAYIREVVSPILSEKVQPLERALSQSQIDRKLENALEFIAEEEGLSKRQAQKKFEKKLADIVESHGFGSLDPYDGTLAAYKIMQTEEKEAKKKEEERDVSIRESHTEQGRSAPGASGKKWTTSLIRSLSRAEFEKHREDILEAQRKGLIVKDN